MKYQVEWLMKPNYFAQDAVFYRSPASSLVAVVKKDDREVEIHVDGETRYYFEDHGVARWDQDWEDRKIFTDDDLRALDQGGWDMNSWFDCYDGKTGEHLDAVTHDIYDALAAAKEILDVA